MNDSPTVPVVETIPASLNPEAPEWQGSKWVPLSEREEVYSLKAPSFYIGFLAFTTFDLVVFLGNGKIR